MAPPVARAKSIGIVVLFLYAFGFVIGLNVLRLFGIELGWPWWLYALAPLAIGAVVFVALAEYTRRTAGRKSAQD